MFHFQAYQPSMQAEWDHFILDSKAPHFMFKRDYMDYHADRFDDCSIIIYNRNNIVGLLPANVEGCTWHSHQGLTFAGVLTKTGGPGVAEVITLFEELREFLRGAGATRLIYKAIPSIYHRQPAQEDLYALWRLGARQTRVDVTTSIYLEQPGKLSSQRRRGVQKASRAGLTYQRTEEWESFWTALTERLGNRHGVQPVHSIAEIKLLAERFPSEIQLHTATLGRTVHAGVVIFQTSEVAHAQYICATSDGLNTGALDGLFCHLIGHFKNRARIFDFGISTMAQGRELNAGLVRQKEGFGGSSSVHQFFELDL